MHFSWLIPFFSTLFFSSSAEIQPARAESVIELNISRVFVNGSQLDESLINKDDHPGLPTFIESIRQGLIHLECCSAATITVTYTPLVANESHSVAAHEMGQASSETCLLSSPWVDAVISRNSNNSTSLNAVFHLDAPSIFFDQALLAGLQVSGEARSVTDAQFMQYAQSYAMALTTGGRGGPDLNALAPEIPAQLLWTFSVAPQSTLGPFFSGAQYTADRLMEQYAGPYANLSIAILSECIRNGSALPEEIHGLNDRYLNQLRVSGKPFSAFVRKLQNISRQKD